MNQIDDVVEVVEKRNLWRRNEDIRRNVILASLAVVLVSIGIAWATAKAAVAQKVDRSEFDSHVVATEKKALVDSLEWVIRDESLRRIEAKVDSTNTRLSRYICNRQPAYCQ